MCFPTRLLLAMTAVLYAGLFAGPPLRAQDDLPANLRVVLDNTEPLRFACGDRLPLYVLPITGTLAGVNDARAEEVLRTLNARGIGYTVDWRPNTFEKSLAEGLRIGAMQKRLGLRVAINANACLYSFFDGTDATFHVDDSGKHFAETSFGGKLGCPFTLQPRIPVVKERLAAFLRAYQKAGLPVDFIFADWEVDGPIEWNDAWASSKKCRVCRREIPRIDDFRQFQKRLREIRADMQRIAFGDNVTRFFPQALVGNYGVYPHDGYRYWYDYFEHFAAGVPFRQDQKARYREWFHEFEQTGYTFAMPVVYTWYPTFDWYDFKDFDYRWFYNMLLVGSNAGQHTPAATPIISFVHWTTTAPPKEADPRVRQFSAEKYQELLWHLLLRGHDTYFLWCVSKELPQEIRLVHQVYAASLQYRGFLDRGTPITWDVPKRAGSVVSGLRLGDRVLVRRTDFANGEQEAVRVPIPGGGELSVPRVTGNQVLEITHRSAGQSFLPAGAGGKGARFPIGFYELPAEDTDLGRMAQAGVNLQGRDYVYPRQVADTNPDR